MIPRGFLLKYQIPSTKLTKLRAKSYWVQYGTIISINLLNIMKTEIQTQNKSTGNSNQSLQRRDEFISPFSLIDRFFDDSIFDSFNMMTPSLFQNRRLGGISTSFPKVDVSETDKEIKVTANIPGIDAENINVEVGDDYLSLSGKVEKENKEESKKGKIYRYEREFGEFRREFSLPARVNKDGIVAKSKNGVLTITLPKSEEEMKKKLKIETE